LFSLEDIQGRAEDLAEDPPFDAGDELKGLRAIDAASVLGAAARHLAWRPHLIAVVKWDERAPHGGKVVREERVE
jgi:hypothetical protein